MHPSGTRNNPRHHQATNHSLALPGPSTAESRSNMHSHVILTTRQKGLSATPSKNRAIFQTPRKRVSRASPSNGHTAPRAPRARRSRHGALVPLPTARARWRKCQPRPPGWPATHLGPHPQRPDSPGQSPVIVTRRQSFPKHLGHEENDHGPKQSAAAKKVNQRETGGGEHRQN